MLYDVAGVIHHTKNQKLTVREQNIYDFFVKHPAGVLSTISETNLPHGTVVYFTLPKNFAASFLTKSGTQKYKNLKMNPHVVLTVFDARQQTVGSIVGEAIEVTDRQRINAIAKAVVETGLHTSDSGINPLAKLDKSPYVAFNIKPAEVRLASYSSPQSDGHHELLEFTDDAA